MIALLASAALALDTNDRLVLELGTGEVVQGWFYAVDAGVIHLTGDNQRRQVPVALVVAVQRDGEPLELQRFQGELAEAQARLDQWRADPPPAPPPALVVGMSVGLWSGLGPAAVGDRRAALRYSIVEGAIVGAAAANLITGAEPGVLVPLGILDLAFRGFAAGEAARISQSRRARISGEVLGPTPP